MISIINSILFVTRFPPDPNGYGGAQRAWHVLRTLAGRGTVDLLVIYRRGDSDIELTQLDAKKLGVRYCAKHMAEGWEEPLKRWPWLPYKVGLFLELLSPYCTEAPRLSKRSLRKLAELIPCQQYDLIVAGRLPAAYILWELQENGMLASDTHIFEMDDVLSQYKRTWIETERSRIGRFRTWLWRVDAKRIETAERRMLSAWDATSVCTTEDVQRLRQNNPTAEVHVIPNIVDRARLADQDGSARVLFVGSLASHPNREGLLRFLNHAWPLIRASVPGVTLDVVGLHPFDGLRERLEAEGGQLYANVPDVGLHYQAATVVISPIFFGSGTRIKVLETMAMGRPLLASSLGAGGLGIEDGQHALIADEMPKFADAVVRLCNDASLRRALANAAHELQQARFGPFVLRQALDGMIDSARDTKVRAT